ncbi:MAG: calcium-binding protein [Nocardioidaceae bacterium]|nr:calcium-binding protein [Nocardioidaceae bacterium]
MKHALVATVAAAIVVLAIPHAAEAAPKAKTYANCTALNKAYPHGVGKSGARDHVTSGSPVTTFTRNNALYSANSKSDRDGDKIACEKK